MSFLRNPFMAVYKLGYILNYWDIIGLVLALSAIFVLAWNAKQMAVPYHLGQVIRFR